MNQNDYKLAEKKRHMNKSSVPDLLICVLCSHLHYFRMGTVISIQMQHLDKYLTQSVQKQILKSTNHLPSQRHYYPLIYWQHLLTVSLFVVRILEFLQNEENKILYRMTHLTTFNSLYAYFRVELTWFQVYLFLSFDH